MEKKMLEFDIHPVCELIPVMSDKDRAELKADIITHGIQMPIITFNGDIVDGRTRYEIYCELWEDGDERELSESQYEGPEHELADFVISLNVRRRSMTSAQRAAAVAKAIKWREQMTGQTVHPKQEIDILAKKNETSSAQVRRALRVADPEKLDEVHAGTKSLAQAIEETEQASSEADGELVDEVGNILTRKTQAAFAERGWFRDIDNAIGKILREVKQRAEGPAGVYLAKALTRIQQDLKNARTSIKGHAPYALCPHCKGDDVECDHCKDSCGYVTKPIFDRLEDGETAA